MLPLIVAVAAAADCPDVAPDVVLQLSGDIELAFSTLDDPRFDAAAAALDRDLPCVRDGLSAADALLLHRAEGLVAFVRGDVDASARSWLAVRALQPEWRPSEQLLPAGHPVRELWEASRPDAAAASLPRFGGGWLVDGVRTEDGPKGRAFVLQALDRDGVVVYTGYHVSIATVPVIELPAAPPPPRRRAIRIGGSAGAGVLLVGAGVSAVLWAGSTREFKGIEQEIVDGTFDGTSEDLSAAKRAANLEGIAAAAAGGLGIVVGTLTWTVRW